MYRPLGLDTTRHGMSLEETMDVFPDIGQISKRRRNIIIGYMWLEPVENIGIKNTHLKENLWARSRRAENETQEKGRKPRLNS